MKSLIKFAALAAATALAPVIAATPASAQFVAGQSVAMVNLDGAVAQSAAFTAAAGQIKTTYATQIAAFEARQNAIQTELTPARTEIENLQKNPATPKATLDAKIAAFQAKAQGYQAELQRLALPFARAQAYAKEQIQSKLEAAVRAAMTAKKVSIALQPDAVVLALPTGDLTADVVTQLNALVPSVSIAVPANWQPGQGAATGQPTGR
jgi:Skp family chaperone for outer membrane proteins